jgi:oxygen-dependent protoporphyrinogen oxidase
LDVPKIIVIGGGVSGLAVAYRLQQAMPSAEITLLEQQQRPGGTARTLREDGFQLEIGPNGFLDTKPTTVALCREIGLGPRLLEGSAAAAKKRFLLLNDRLHMLPNSFGSFLRTNLLSVRGKLGFLLERFRKGRAPDRDESIAAFAQRRAGKEVADVFADALVTGIYAGDPELLSLPACFPRIAAFERSAGSVLKGFAQEARRRREEAQSKGVAYERPGKMWSFQEGMRVLPETLAALLKSPPVYGVCVRHIERQGDPARPTWRVLSDGHDEWQASAVILTCPAHQQAGLVESVDPTLAEEIAGIAYNRVAVVGLGFRQADVPNSLDGFGYIAPQRSRRDVLGVQWCSSIFPQRAPGGAILLRAMCGGWHRAEMVGWDDQRLLAAVRSELGVAMGIQAAPIFQKIIRWERAIPQYHVGHLDRLSRIQQKLTRHPGLFLGGNAYRGVALNDCTEQGALVASQVSDYLRKTISPVGSHQPLR